MPVAIPKGVDAKLDGNTLRLKGPKGELTQTFHPNVTLKRDDGTLTVARKDDEKATRALHGLTRALIQNMVTGVTTGYARDLEINGTGFRAIIQGKKLQLNLGFSHPVEIDPPAGITFAAETPQKLKISGVDKQAVGEMAAKIRSLRVPDPYKHKGIKYAEERLRKKAGKAGKVGAKAG